MTNIDDTIRLIQEAHADLGSPELARISGLPYTTVHYAAKRAFGGPAVETLRKLEGAVKSRAKAKSSTPITNSRATSPPSSGA